MLCKNPKLVFNKYLGHNVYVACGHCSACQIQKSNKYFSLIQNECDNHPYNIFFTLTYSNDKLPIVREGDNNIYRGLSDEIIETKEKPFKLFDTPNIYKLVGNNIVVDDAYKNVRCVVSVKDCQNFIKRLRRYFYQHNYMYLKKSLGLKSLNELSYEKQNWFKKKVAESSKLRYVIVSEYGTARHRCHYHGIIHCDTKRAAEWLLANIPTCWKFCNWNSVAQKKFHGRSGLPSFIEKSAAAYVSSYICATDISFPFAKQTSAKPFIRYSKIPLYGLSKVENDVVKEVFSSGNFKFSTIKSLSNGDSVNVKCSNRVLSRLWGNFEGLNNKTNEDICAIISRPCLYSRRSVQNFVTKIRKRIKDFYGRVTSATIQDYVARVRNLQRRFQSFLLFDKQLSKFSASNPIDYVKQNYQTFTSYLDTSPYGGFEGFTIRSSIFGFLSRIEFNCYESGSIIDVIFHPFDVFSSDINKLVTKYKNRLMPKHSHSLNFNYYATV